jgi:ABC-type multidrug transport system ATPase subunit
MLQSQTGAATTLRDSALQVRGISKTYPSGIQALADVTLSIPVGVYGVLGPHGSGKSTLLRILSSVQEPDRGSISIEGSPRVTVIDEPTAGLEPAERQRVLNRLADLGHSQVVVLATSRVEDVAAVCTRMAIIDRGNVLVEYDPASAINQIRGRVWRREVEREDVRAIERAFVVLRTKQAGNRVVVHVYADTASLEGFDRVEPDLEDVYGCALTGHCEVIKPH